MRTPDVERNVSKRAAGKYRRVEKPRDKNKTLAGLGAGGAFRGCSYKAGPCPSKWRTFQGPAKEKSSRSQGGEKNSLSMEE